jgi:hypothetical protein
MSDNLRLTFASGYNTKNIICTEPKTEEITGADGKKLPPFQRINIFTKHSDGSVGDLIIPTEELFSFGISENTDQKSGEVTGHTMALCLWERDRQTNKFNPTKEQLEWSNTFSAIIEEVKRQVINLQQSGKLLAAFSPSAYEQDEFKVLLKKMNPLYWGKGSEKAPVLSSNGQYENSPTLYAKLIESKKTGKVISQFFDYDGNEIDALKVLKGAYCNTRVAIKFESVFVGAKISIQIKIYEAECKIIELGMKRLLSVRKPINNRILTGSESTFSQHNESQFNQEETHNDRDDDRGSIKDEDEQEEEEQPKKVIKKRVVKVVKPTS